MKEDMKAAKEIGFQDGLKDATNGNRDMLDMIRDTVETWAPRIRDAYYAAYAKGLRA